LESFLPGFFVDTIPAFYYYHFRLVRLREKKKFERKSALKSMKKFCSCKVFRKNYQSILPKIEEKSLSLAAKFKAYAK
jgi:hypothetical protein